MAQGDAAPARRTSFYLGTGAFEKGQPTPAAVQLGRLLRSMPQQPG